MAQDEDSKKAVTRRNFLSLASVTAAQAALLPTAERAEAEPAPPADSNELVYRETPHIRTYYQRNRF